MAYAALIPFIVLFSCFAFLRIALTHASFIALLVCSVISATLFHATDLAWNAALLKTSEFLVEIGLILIGAFYFIEVSQKTKVIDSLASLIKEVSHHRTLQGILVAFPMELMVEGSSGFGTPLLIIAPLLVSLHFPIELCALLPYINMIIGIPFGALGTPIRLSFPNADPLLTHQTTLLMAPFALIGPFLSYYLIHRFDQKNHGHERHFLKTSLWIFLMSLVYLFFSLWISYEGPEFPTLCAALITFVFGILSARILFHRKNATPLKNKMGLSIYALLLLFLWLGKKIWMDEVVPGTHIRKFNPGVVFILFGLALNLYFKSSILASAKAALQRARRTLFVFFCMTFMVQQLRNNGGLEILTSNLPTFFLEQGVSLMGWMGSIFIGTATVTNLLFAKVVSPAFYAALTAGSAFGVQLSFQSLSAVRSILNDRMTEKQILAYLLPIGVLSILLLTLTANILTLFF